MTQFTPMAEQAGYRSQNYWLLSRLFLEVPQASFLQELDHILSAACGADADCDLEGLRNAVQDASSADAAPDAVAVAFTRHLSLAGKGDPLPYEAYAREGKLPGDATEQVLALMGEAGFDDVAPEASSPDHLGAELRFMAFLCLAERDAWLAGDQVSAAHSLQRQQHFMKDHLDQWAGEFCADLAQRVTHPYLLAICKLTESSIDEDARALEEICNDLEVDTVAPTLLQ